MAIAALQFAPTVPGRIHRAGFGWLNYGGKIYEHDRVLHQDGISPVWWRNRRHWFDLDDAMAIVDRHRPELLILGTGWMGMMRIDLDALTAGLARAGVTFQAHRTPDAILLYQRAFQQGIQVAAGLHVTC